MQTITDRDQLHVDMAVLKGEAPASASSGARNAAEVVARAEQVKADLAALKRDNKTDEAPPKKCPALDAAKRLALEGQSRNRWVLTLAKADDYPLCFDPQFWRTCSGKLNRGDRLEVRDDFLTFAAELVVVEANHWSNFVVVREIFHKNLEQHQHSEEASDQFEIRDMGVTERFAVVRKATGKVMKSGFKDHASARDHIRHTFYETTSTGQIRPMKLKDA